MTSALQWPVKCVLPSIYYFHLPSSKRRRWTGSGGGFGVAPVTISCEPWCISGDTNDPPSSFFFFSSNNSFVILLEYGTVVWKQETMAMQGWRRVKWRPKAEKERKGGILRSLPTVCKFPTIWCTEVQESFKNQLPPFFALPLPKQDKFIEWLRKLHLPFRKIRYPKL